MQTPTICAGLTESADNCDLVRTKSGQRNRLKRGDVREDGKVFVCYQRGKEYWTTPEQFKKTRDNKLKLDRQWRQANKARNCELVKEWRKRNPERAREILRKAQAAYMSENPEKRREKDNRRRAIKKSAIAHDHRPDIADVLETMRSRLTACTGIEWHLDHVMPLGAGGLHAHWNMQVIPGSWNIRKKDHPTFQLPDCYRMPL
jgi:hypothetical protein